MSLHLVTPSPRAVQLATAAAAAGAALLSPLLALAYLGQPEGAKYLHGTVAWWAVPARDLLDPLLTWASPERVYGTYVQLFAPIYLAMVAGALAVRAGRGQTRRDERWGWRIVLTGFALSTIGLLILVPALVTDPAGAGAVVNVGYLAGLLPGTLLDAVGSTVLGIAWLRAGFLPRAAAWLLALSLIWAIVIPDVLGHNSLGLVPVTIAWALATRSLPSRTVDEPSSPDRADQIVVDQA